MVFTHEQHGHAHSEGGLQTMLPVAVVLLVAAGYGYFAWRRRHDPKGWSAWRTSSFLLGIALLIAAIVPQLSPFPEGDFRGHMYQHLLIGMYAPLALALSAPLTLTLRSIPRRQGKVIGRILRSGPMQVLANPVTALVLVLGGMAALYFTPLYQITTGNPLVHDLVHLHFFLAGYLFAYVIAGADPAPHRPSVPARLVILGVAIVGHAVLAQLLYANAGVQVPVPIAQLRGGADLMYYGGDIAELLLALAIVTTWRPRSQHRPSPARTPREKVVLREPGQNF